jgi:hypothetical protein
MQGLGASYGTLLPDRYKDVTCAGRPPPDFVTPKYDFPLLAEYPLSAVALEFPYPFAGLGSPLIGRKRVVPGGEQETPLSGEVRKLPDQDSNLD